MRKRILFYAASIALLAVTGTVAQEIRPVFLTTHNDNGSVLPILIKKGRTVNAAGTELGTWTDGTRTQDEYFGLRRYDENRLLLGVFHNGINENDPNDNQALAQQFPDRSLIWINPNTGAPEGVALVIGVKPIEPTPEFVAEYDSGPISFYLAFDLSDEGFIYVAFGEYILRYKPDGQGSFTGPEKVYQQDIAADGVEDWGINAFNVQGSGTNTRIVGGHTGKGYLLTTNDGNTFQVAQTFESSTWPTLHGPMSNILSNEEFAEEYILFGGYGGASRGDDSTFYRMVRSTDDPESVFQIDNDFFQAQGKPDAAADEYLANYVGAIAGLDGLPWIVVYSTPSWDNSVKLSPGFLALHDVSASTTTFEKDGAYIDDFMLNVYSSEEPRLPGVTVSSWYGTQGTLEVNVPAGAPAGAAEILWGGGIYGYGRFAVGDLPTSVSHWSVF